MRAEARPSAKFADAAPLFAALGDSQRLYIVGRLCADGPQSIVNLTEGAKISRQAVTKHLQALERAGLVHGKRLGRERIWELRTKRLHEAERHLARISEQWDSAIERLRALVEEA